ncbi:SGNH/GDSL hydrolase family protein, partial [archaeon]|nr:SGNH/GDSL hydrolase family protein [archaeon]
YELINRSRFQENSFDGIWTFSEDIEPFEPVILIIHFGVDDAFFPVYRSEYKENLVRMVKRSRDMFSPAIFILTSHTFDDRYDMEAVNIFYRAAREVAVDLECSLVPVHTYWAGYLNNNGLTNKDLVLSDTRYPNEHGHRVIAEAVRLRLEHFL